MDPDYRTKPDDPGPGVYSGIDPRAQTMFGALADRLVSGIASSGLKLKVAKVTKRLLPASLRARILLLVALAALPAIAGVISSALHERSHAIAMATTSLSLQTYRAVSHYQAIGITARELLQNLAANPEVAGGDMKACAAALSARLVERELFANLGVIDANGKVICSGLPSQNGVSAADRTYFRKAVETRDFTTSDYQIGRITRQGSINYVLPVFEKNGKLRMVLFANYQLSNLTADLVSGELPAGAVVTMLDPAFAVVARSNHDRWVGQSIVGTEMHLMLSQGEASGVRNIRGLDAGELTVAYTRAKHEYGDTQGYVVISMPVGAVLEPANRITVRNLAYLGIIFLGIAVLAVIGADVLVLNKVRDLFAATRRFAAGDFSARVPDARGDNCVLVALGTAFNEMADKIDAQVRSISSLNRTYALLTAINAAIFRIRDRDELANETCRIAVDVGQYQSACIFLVDPKSSTARLAAHTGAGKDILQDIKVAMNEPLTESRGAIARALITGKHATVQDVEVEAAPQRVKRWRAFGVRSEIAIPLTAAGKVCGVLALFDAGPGAFGDEKELKLLLQLAADTSLGLEHIEKEQQIARLNRTYAVLTEINSAILRIHETNMLADEACRIAVDTGGYLTACILLNGKNTTHYGIAGHAGAGREYFEYIQSDPVEKLGPANTPLIKALGNGGHAVEQNFEIMENHPWQPRLLEYGVRSVAAFPLLVDGQVAGALVLWSATSHAFNNDEVQLLLQLAADTGLGLERNVQQARLYELSNFDRLTGLPNRSLFEDRATQALSRAPHLERVAAVLMVRVGRMRQINDQYGWTGGNEVLMEVARYLQQAVRPGDTVARLGDNEFGILLADVRNVEDVFAATERITADFPGTISRENNRIKTDCSIGVAIFPQDGPDAPALIRNAELALNNMTADPGNVIAFYSTELDRQAHERHVMESELAGAMERNELSVVYQPIVRIADRTTVGAEALLRWNNRVLGPVSPAVFVPLAEQSGLITAIGAWVFESACAQRLAWAPCVSGKFRLAVNVSAVQLRAPDFLSKVSRILKSTGLDPRRNALCIEMTESELMEDIDRGAPALAQLKDLGLLLSIDDFGIGYSSLSYLRRLPADILKIDISFVREIATNPEARALAESIVVLAHNLSLCVVAEGVETEAQLNVLAAMGCDAAQGYLFSRPVLPAEFEQLIFKPI